MKIGNLRNLGSLNNVWQKIYSNTLSSAATSITISDLNGDSDVEYMIKAKIVNGYNGACGYWLYINNDSAANHYGYQVLQGVDTVVAAFRGADAGIFLNATSITNLGYLLQSEVILFAKSGFVRTALVESSNNINGTTIGQIYNMGFSWNNTADNITSLVLSAAQANGLGIGTQIDLYRRIS